MTPEGTTAHLTEIGPLRATHGIGRVTRTPVVWGTQTWRRRPGTAKDGRWMDGVKTDLFVFESRSLDGFYELMDGFFGLSKPSQYPFVVFHF